MGVEIGLWVDTRMVETGIFKEEEVDKRLPAPDVTVGARKWHLFSYRPGSWRLAPW